MNITPEMVQALAALREFAKATNAERYPHPIDAEAAKAVDLLDNEDFFAAIDEVADEMETAAQFGAGLGPAEQGDTSTEDITRLRFEGGSEAHGLTGA